MNNIERMMIIEVRLTKLFPTDFIKTQITRIGFADDEIRTEYSAFALERDRDNYHLNITSTKLHEIEDALTECETNTPMARLNTVLAAVREAIAP